MRGEHERGAALPELAERGQGRGDPRVVGHRAAVERHVEVGADEDARAVDVAEVVERAKRHEDAIARRIRAWTPTRAATSTSRFEYPHSLSYQPIAFTTSPMTIVALASNVHDA